jgi:hypothetical protein
MFDNTSDNDQSCIRFGKSVGINLNQVVAWKYVPPGTNSPAILEIFFAGTTFTIKENEVDEKTFLDLSKALRKKFHINGSPSPSPSPSPGGLPREFYGEEEED